MDTDDEVTVTRLDQGGAIDTVALQDILVCEKVGKTYELYLDDGDIWEIDEKSARKVSVNL